MLFKRLVIKTLQVNSGLKKRNLWLSCKMQLKLDSSLKGMIELEREKFHLELNVPAVKILKSDFAKIKRILVSFTSDSFNKKYQNLDETDPLFATHKYLLLDPDEFDLKKLDESKRIELISTLKQDKVSFANIYKCFKTFKF